LGYRILRAGGGFLILVPLVFTLLTGGTPVTPFAGVAAGVQNAAVTTDEDAAVEVPPASDKALAYYRSGNVLWRGRVGSLA
jgi:hypothetical protein